MATSFPRPARSVTIALVCALSGLIIGAAASRMGYFLVLCTSAGAALGFFIWILAQWDLWPMMFTSDDPNSTSPW